METVVRFHSLILETTSPSYARAYTPFLLRDVASDGGQIPFP